MNDSTKATTYEKIYCVSENITKILLKNSKPNSGQCWEYCSDLALWIDQSTIHDIVCGYVCKIHGTKCFRNWTMLNDVVVAGILFVIFIILLTLKFGIIDDIWRFQIIQAISMS